MGQVAGQLVAPVRRVGPDHHGAGQGGRLEPEDELGDVVEQHGHVEGPVGPSCMQPGRPLGRRRHDLGVGQPEVAGHEAELGVVGPGSTAPAIVSGGACWASDASLHLRTP